MSSAPEQATVEAAVGLGSNEGDRLSHLRTARQRLLALPGVRLLGCSPVYETEPVGVPDAYREQWYLNAVLLVGASGWTPDAWSDALHGIEAALGRVRTGERNAPRPIDIDLLTFGGRRLSRPGLTLPHPQCAQRRFVCRPLADLRPALRLPGRSETVAELLQALPERPAVRLFAETW